jgi:hypothetical protein
LPFLQSVSENPQEQGRQSPYYDLSQITEEINRTMCILSGFIKEEYPAGKQIDYHKSNKAEKHACIDAHIMTDLRVIEEGIDIHGK